MALTNRYVNNAGSGLADGTSEANAMSFATFTDYMVTGGSFTAAAGDVFLLKLDGTYSRTTTTDAWVNGGTVTSPVVVRGYSSSITDGYQGRDSVGELVTTNMPVITYTTGRLNVTGTFIVIENLNVSSANSGYTISMAANSVIKSCKATNSSTNANVGGISCSYAIDCDAVLSGASGGGVNAGILATTGYALANRITTGATTSPGIQLAGGSRQSYAIGNVVHSSGGIGVSIPATSTTGIILFNTLVGCAGDGIDIVTGNTNLHTIVGNMITDNGGFGIDMVSASNAGFLAYNRTRDNTSGAINSGTDWAAATTYAHVTTDTGGGTTDYVDPTTDDYRLIAASPATSAAILPKMSIGALQRDQTGGSSGAGIPANLLGGILQ